MEELGPRRLVIDSFTAAVQGFGDPREVRVLLHTLLSKVVRLLNCTMILVEEIPHGDLRIGYGFEEFVASMTVILRMRLVEGRILRELVVPKLRRAGINAPITCFTIHNGIKVFPPWKSIEIRALGHIRPYRRPVGDIRRG